MQVGRAGSTPLHLLHLPQPRFQSLACGIKVGLGDRFGLTLLCRRLLFEVYNARGERLNMGALVASAALFSQR